MITAKSKQERRVKRTKRYPKAIMANTTAGERAMASSDAPPKPLKVEVALNPRMQKKIDAMAFKQIQTNSRMDRLEKTLELLTDTTLGMRDLVMEQLKRIRCTAPVTDEPVFFPRAFNKVSFRLRKKSVDVQVEDILNGEKRRRVYRCSDFSKVEHLICYRTMTEGIELLERRVPLTPAKKRAAANARKRAVATRAKNKAHSLDMEANHAEVAYMMGKEGVKNSVVPSKSKKTMAYDPTNDAAQIAENRSRAAAEKVITKICSKGGVAEGAKDGVLIDALVANGFQPQVAFYAAHNCGRVTDPIVIKKHTTKKAKAKSGSTSNEY
jgi:hypothetical protein